MNEKERNERKNCVLIEDLECTGCGACNLCDLKPNKICDNCCACLGDADYRGIIITEIRTSPEEPEEDGGKKQKPASPG
ncbi:MAG: hypothetical protein ACUVRM_11695 [Bacillota bacterium]